MVVAASDFCAAPPNMLKVCELGVAVSLDAPIFAKGFWDMAGAVVVLAVSKLDS